MMKFTLTIKLDNETFDVPDQTARVRNGEELSRIIASQVCDADLNSDYGHVTEGDMGTVFDYNGNRIGEWKVTR